MKLFTIPITTGPHAGKELVGIDFIPCVCPDPCGKCLTINEGLYGNHELIGYISNITEEQAKELGFGSEITPIAKDDLRLTVTMALVSNGHSENLTEDVLLILVEP